ncbi:MAG: CDGSH iron-sulfur domain-containing protein [Actinobacteria bacterium]|jgi:CDGSH-type Zn-finger protein|nr:CDGSH iron-sulfur domain-containing protein [Actinomycetota bacterium]
MSENIKMQFKKNASIRVTGTVDFVDADGNIVETKTDFSLCRCGHSKEKPFCDGSHREAGFVSE